ncbi:MAG: nucleoside-triphosphatase [Acidimicrobiaceae bacterium]|nr:nucleoside-triphosphatase [Acidimicrobiaceae bacterium]
MTSAGAPVRLVLASANAHKVVEIAEILAGELAGVVELVPRPTEVPDVDETGSTLEENARLKALAIASATGLGAVADDSGLEVDLLGGAPGVHSARYAGVAASYEDNVSKLLGALEGSSGRTARFRTVALARLADGRELACEGVVEGHIAERPSGTAGFGYDPVFVPVEGNGQTFAEMPAAAKHAISARGRAFRALAGLLRSELVGAREA